MKSIYEAQFGDHNCVVYNSRHDLNDLLAQYFKYGFENGEFCIWVTPGADNDNDARRALDRILPDSKKRLIKEQIEFLDCADFYLKGGSFNPDLVLKQWLDRLNRAIGEGYKGMRVTGDVGWLQKTDWQSFMDYETKINQSIGLNRLVVVCSYPLAKLGTSEMVDIMQRHAIAVIKNNGEWHMFAPLEPEKPAESQIDRFRPTSLEYQEEAGILGPIIYPEKCDGCGLCIDVCQRGVLYLENNSIAVKTDVICDFCTNCEAICPTGAIACPFEITMA